MSITIEKIKDKQFTVIYHIDMQNSIYGFHQNRIVRWSEMATGELTGFCQPTPSYTLPIHAATALPAIPMHPTSKDAPLLYAYAAHNVFPMGEHFHGDSSSYLVMKDEDRHEYLYDMATNNSAFTAYYWITHAMHNGERVEIAIEGYA